MKIATFIMCHNEEKILPFTLRHYLQFSEVTVMENNSTDKSVEIAQKMGAKVWDIHTPNEFNDFFNRNLKNNCWKTSSADWVIVVDADEFVYCPNIKEVLSKTDATILKTAWYEMYSESFPTGDRQLYDYVTLGHLGRTKTNLFMPSQINEVNYDTGSHYAAPRGNVVIKETTEVKTLHFRHLGMDYIMERNERTEARMSQKNKESGISIHFAYPREKVLEEYMDGISKADVVI